MIFTTYWFCLFACLFFPLYWLARVSRLRLALVLVFCVAFQAHFAGAAGMWPVVILAIVTYFAGFLARRWALILAIVTVTSALIVYKYSHFIATGLIGAAMPRWGVIAGGWATTWLPAAPPLGISFFAFEFVHYLYDVAHGSRPIKNPANFFAFALFFPSLVAGPIKRYQPFLESLDRGLSRVSPDDVKLGLVRVATGFFKKVVIADNLTSAIDFWQPRFSDMSLLGRWELFVGIGLRILMDFSGYSDIAIGLARMMGIPLLENFNWPYFATSLQEFWRRWHISLSSWVRDYVYIPLGGNRRGLARKALNALIAFALIGLWHGAAWNFVIWGLYHGAGLAISSNYRSVTGAPGRAIGAFFSRFPWAGWAVTTAFVFAGWLFFFYSIPVASQMLRLLFVTRA